MTQEILLEVFKKVSLYDLSEATFEHGDEDGEMYINALRGLGSVFDAIKYDGNLFWMMNTGGDFSLLNPMVDAFMIYITHLQQQEFNDGMNSAMYCVHCQALHEQECFCDEIEQEDDRCSECGATHGTHFIECQYNNNPFDNLLRDGYD